MLSLFFRKSGMESFEDRWFSMCWGIELGQRLLNSWGPLFPFSCFPWGLWFRELLFLGNHMDRKAHYSFALAKLIVIGGNMLAEQSLRVIPAPASKVKEGVSLLKLREEACSSVSSRMPFRGPSVACFTTFLLDVIIFGSFLQTIGQIHDTLELRHGRPCQPVSFQFSSRGDLVHSLSNAHRSRRMVFWEAPQPACHSFPGEPSETFCVAVMTQTVALSGRHHELPKSSWVTGVRGAKKLVVEQALLTILTILRLWSWFLWSMPKHVDISRRDRDDDGPWAPSFQWVPAFSKLMKTSVVSTTYLEPASPHLMWVLPSTPSYSWKVELGLPQMTSFPFSALIVV